MIAVNDGRIVKLGDNARASAASSVSRTSTATRYTYGHLGSIARKLPGAEGPQRERRAGQAGARAAQARREADRRRERGHAPPGAGAPRTAKPTRAKARAGKRRIAANATSADTAPVAKERLFANPERPAAFRNGGQQPARSASASGSTSVHGYFTAALGLDPRRRTCSSRCSRGASVIAGTILGRIGKTDPSLAPHVDFEIRPAGRGAPRDRPEADPRRLEAARVDRDLPRRGQEPVLRRRRRAPVDRPDPADEQGGARSSACSPTRDIDDLRLRPPGHPAPARSTAACSRRSSSSSASGLQARRSRALQVRPQLPDRRPATSPSTRPATRSTSPRSTASRSSATRARARSPTSRSAAC